MKTKLFAMLALGVLVGAGGMALVPGLLNTNEASQPYAGQDAREITSLSAKDIAELKKGAGWGLAKPAEFNGYPGPAHVLEFSDKLAMSDAQKAAIQSSFEAMNAKARELGEALIEAEAALDDAFKSKSADDETLRNLLSRTEAARASLRHTHLAAHLEVTPLLTESQKLEYAKLRGYGSGNHSHSGH